MDDGLSSIIYRLVLSNFLAFLAVFVLVLLLERVIHRALQEVMLLITADSYRATALYSLVLLPGVALHETSHALMAVLLGVKVRKFSLFPRKQGGGIQLGMVEINATDAWRSSLIGAAPMLTGIIALMLIGWYVFNFGQIRAAINTGQVNGFVEALLAIVRTPDAFLWFYAVFAIANTMMPSPSDRQAWPSVILVMALVGAMVFIIGGMTLIRAVSPVATDGLRWLMAAFAITAFIDVIVIAALFLFRALVERVSGRRLRY